MLYSTASASLCQNDTRRLRRQSANQPFDELITADRGLLKLEVRFSTASKQQLDLRSLIQFRALQEQFDFIRMELEYFGYIRTGKTGRLRGFHSGQVAEGGGNLNKQRERLCFLLFLQFKF